MLVASGDQNLGGRGVLDGPIQYLPIDHTYPQLPGAGITAGDPLAGLRLLATQVAAAGVGTVGGDVIIDDRLFETWRGWEQSPISPIVLNDNEIDVAVRSHRRRPGGDAQLAAAGARLERPVRGHHGGRRGGDRRRAHARGAGAAGGDRVGGGRRPAVLAGWFVDDPAAFARSAFIAELEAAGVEVTAPATGPNPASALPARGSYADDQQVAALESAPLSETVTLVLKVSHNWGAELFACLVAVADGSTSCPDGLAGMYDVAERAGIDRGEVYLLDGAGSSLSRFSPTAGVRSRRVDDDPALGRRAPPGTPRPGRERRPRRSSPARPPRARWRRRRGPGRCPMSGPTGCSIQARAMTGFIEAASGRELHVSLFVQNVPVASIEELLQVALDVIDVTVAIQQRY